MLHVSSNVIAIAIGVVFLCKKSLACGVPFLMVLVLHLLLDRELALFSCFYGMNK